MSDNQDTTTTTQQSEFVKPDYTEETINFNFKTEHDFQTDFKPLVAKHGLFKCHNTRKNIISEDLIKYRAHKAVKTEYWTCDHAFKKRAKKINDDPNIKRRKTKKASKKTECKAKFTKIFFADDTIEVRYIWKHTGHDPVTDVKPKKRKLPAKEVEQLSEVLDRNDELDDELEEVDIDDKGHHSDEHLERSQNTIEQHMDTQVEVLDKSVRHRSDVRTDESSKDQEQQLIVRSNESDREIRIEELDKDESRQLDLRSNKSDQIHIPTRVKRSHTEERSNGSDRDDEQQLDARIEELDKEIENLKKALIEEIESVKSVTEDEDRREKIERLQLFVRHMQDLVSNLQKTRIPQN